MRYEEALRWLYALQPRGIRLELDRMRAALALRGDPQAALRAVHVAGTNGKGSTSAMVASALGASGARVGLYTSPHLHSFCERIRIDGAPIARDEVARRVSEVRATLEREGAPELTFFEVTTLVAFEAFRDAGCDAVVLEVGLGGRLDATNVIERPLACTITGIAMDHQAHLGETIEAIAREKAGILKPGVPAVIGPMSEAAREVIAARGRDVGAPLAWVGGEIAVAVETATFSVRVGDRVIDGLSSALEGAHQRDNAAVAVGVLVALGVDDDSIRRGLAGARWPGRLERIGNAIVDAAHNPDGARALAAALGAMPRTGPRVLVFGAMADKQWREMLAALRSEVDVVIAVAPPMPRAERAEAIAEHAGGQSASSIAAGVDRARELAGAHGLVVVAGSIFVLAEARAHLLGVGSEPAIPM